MEEIEFVGVYGEWVFICWGVVCAGGGRGGVGVGELTVAGEDSGEFGVFVVTDGDCDTFAVDWVGSGGGFVGVWKSFSTFD